MLGRHRPMYFETKRSESRSESRSSSSLQLYNSPPMHAPAALCLIQYHRSQRYAMLPRGHMRYSLRRLAVDEPGALVMADRPFQPGRTWRTGERPGSTVTRPHPVLVLLGDSESTTHGPWRWPSHFVLLCRARTPEWQPHAPTHPRLPVQRDTRLLQSRSAVRTGWALSRRSIPGSRNTRCCFGLVQLRPTMPECPPRSLYPI